MSGSKSDYLEKAILDHLVGGSTLAKPTNVYIAVSTAAYSDAATGASMTEVTGGGYGRVAVSNNASNWPNATGSSPALKQNGAPFTFPTASSSWGTLLSFYIVDAASGGNILYGGDLATAKTVGSGDTATFATGTISITED